MTDTTQIHIKQDLYTTVDNVDSDLDDHNWSLSHGYAYRRIVGGHESMARVILARKLGRPIGEGLQVDHINRDRLDNQRDNLREVTQAQNTQNLSKSRKNTSGYVGVSFDKGMKKWRAHIRVNTKLKALGSFSDRRLAAFAYDDAARPLGRPLNFPDRPYDPPRGNDTKPYDHINRFHDLAKHTSDCATNWHLGNWAWCNCGLKERMEDALTALDPDTRTRPRQKATR